MGGAWWPARAAERLAPAQALKGLSRPGRRDARACCRRWTLLLAAGALALLPPWRGLPLAAYASVAALLAGGVALVPATVQALLDATHRNAQPLLLLAWQRARHQRHTASAAVAGVVASVALSVALLVMVGSFRDAVSSWLDGVLPADLYLRTVGGSARRPTPTRCQPPSPTRPRRSPAWRGCAPRACARCRSTPSARRWR